jgi:acyl carrier protein
MVIDGFTEEFADAIEISRDEVSKDTEFKQLEIWDSLCVLTIIAMVDTTYGITVSGRDLESSRTVGDLFDLVRSRTK